MTLKRAFSDADGAESTVVVEKMDLGSAGETAFADLPTGVQAAVTAAGLNTNDDWVKGLFLASAGSRSYWFSLGAGTVTVT